MKSIMHSKAAGTCYLCMMLHGDDARRTTQEHHVIFGWANRRLSEKYGLKVYLCLSHHETGREAVHKNAKIAKLLKKEAQRVFEQSFPQLSFRQIFGANYLEDADRQQASEKPPSEPGGFRVIDNGIEELDW